MKDVIKIELPLTHEKAKKLQAGDIVSISGIIYAARDEAHKRMINMMMEGKGLPIDVNNQVIYYVGPCPAKPGHVIGSAGPTTSGRMDSYAPKLIELGLTGMIGKGLRSKDVVASMKKHGAVYFGAIGGAAALIAKKILRQDIIAFPELGAEALRKMEIRDFPAVVVIDSKGNDLYETGKKMYRNE